MLTRHVFLNVAGEVVASHLDAVVGHDATQRDHGNLGGAAAYVDNHVALGCKHVEAYAQGCCHGLIYHVHVAAAGMLARVAHGTYLHLGRARGYAHHHAQRG